MAISQHWKCNFQSKTPVSDNSHVKRKIRIFVMEYRGIEPE